MSLTTTNFIITHLIVGSAPSLMGSVIEHSVSVVSLVKPTNGVVMGLS